MSINIAYACDEYYMEQTSVSLISLFENTSNPSNISVFFINMGISEESKDYLLEIVNKYDAKLEIINFVDIAYDLNIDSTGRHIASVYAKLFFGRILGIDKILYLDSDTVVMGDIVDLYNIDISNYCCAGVETIHTIKDNEEMGLAANIRAINDGIVLMNLKLWRDKKILEKCLEYISRYNGNPPVLSEGTINNICQGMIRIIDPRYNLMSGIYDSKKDSIKKMTRRDFYTQEEIDKAKNKPCIVHFLAGFYNRPWYINCTHPLKNEYLRYRSYTKWKDDDLKKSIIPFRIKIIGSLYHILPINCFCFIRRIISK